MDQQILERKCSSQVFCQFQMKKRDVQKNIAFICHNSWVIDYAVEWFYTDLDYTCSSIYVTSSAGEYAEYQWNLSNRISAFEDLAGFRILLGKKLSIRKKVSALISQTKFFNPYQKKWSTQILEPWPYIMHTSLFLLAAVPPPPFLPPILFSSDLKKL